MMVLGCTLSERYSVMASSCAHHCQAIPCHSERGSEREDIRERYRQANLDKLSVQNTIACLFLWKNAHHTVKAQAWHAQFARQAQSALSLTSI